MTTEALLVELPIQVSRFESEQYSRLFILLFLYTETTEIKGVRRGVTKRSRNYFLKKMPKKDLPDFRVGVAAREVAKAKKVGLLKTEPLANIVHAIAA